MKFYLGTHMPNWLREVKVPLFVSHRRLLRQKKLPKSITPWALDSGGFTELSMHGRWVTSEADYISAVRRYRDEIGMMEWAAPMDWMCEPWINEKTGLSVREHQARTVANYLSLRRKAPDLPFVPVLQGWTLREYQDCADLYERVGVDLRSLPFVAIGSVCRRQQTQGGREVIEYFASEGIPLHAFGFKLNGLAEVGHLLASSDSMAWSYGARMNPPLEGCKHGHCGNCKRWALRWRLKVLKVIAAAESQGVA